MQSVYPTGTTIYEPNPCDNGYTLLWSEARPRLIDMNGRVVHEWPLDIEMSAGDEPRAQRAKLRDDGALLLIAGSTASGWRIIADRKSVV